MSAWYGVEWRLNKVAQLGASGFNIMLLLRAMQPQDDVIIIDNLIHRVLSSHCVYIPSIAWIACLFGLREHTL